MKFLMQQQKCPSIDLSQEFKELEVKKELFAAREELFTQPKITEFTPSMAGGDELISPVRVRPQPRPLAKTAVTLSS